MHVASRVPMVAGWAAFGGACLLVAAGAVLRGDAQAPFGEDAVLAVGFTGLGALVLSRQPRNRAGWLCLTPLLAAVAFFADAYAAAGALPGVGWAAWLVRWIWIPGLLPALTVLLLVLPDGRLPGPRWRPAGWLIGTVITALTVLVALIPAGPGLPPGPVEVAALAALPESPVLVFLLPVLGCAMVGLAGLIRRSVRARATERAQLTWITLGAAVFVLGSLLNSGLPQPWPPVVAQAAALTLPVGFGIAMLRHRLLDLNRLLRTLVLTVTLAVVLFGLFTGLRAVLGDGPLAAAAITVGLALATPSAARWLGGGVDRIVYGRRGDPAGSVAGLVRGLGTVATPDEVLRVLVDVTLAALPVSAARAVLISGDRELSRADLGDPDRATTDLAVLRFGDDLLGRLEVAAQRELDEADRALLDDLASTAAAGVAAAHRALELQRSREALVLAREQERRRIARDLHDGVGPVLSGLGFTLDALRIELRDRAGAGAHTAAQAGMQVREAVQLVRGLSRELRPASIDQVGLAGALAEIAARHTSDDLLVHLDFPGADRPITAAAEVAAHAIVAEAVTNAARHSGARCCRVAVRHKGAVLIVEVRDDGRGLCGAAAGVGRSSMIERASELGGWCMISSDDGTVVAAELPNRGPAA